MIKSKTLAALVVCGSLVCSTAFAATVEFPAGQTSGSFNCTLSNPLASAKIDTDKLEVSGGNEGGEYAKSAGHLDGVPSKVFKEFYFKIKKSLAQNGSVTITPSLGDVTCSTGHGDKAHSFGGDKFGWK